MRAKTIVYEIRPGDKQEYVTVMCISRKPVELMLSEILIRVKQCYPFFVKPTKEEWKKYKHNLIELYKIKSNEYFEEVKKKVENGELTPEVNAKEEK